MRFETGLVPSRRVSAFACCLAACLAIMLAAPARSFAVTGATFTYPANGATNVDTATPFAWTLVSGVQAYTLWVGTTQGASDLVNTAETQTTSWQVPPLPGGTQLWARIWTQASGAWSYQDVSFTALPLTKTYLSYPQYGGSAVDPSTPFSWYAVPNASSYTLYVGTTQAGNNLLNTNEIQTTSYQVPPLPTGQTLWARVWAKVNGSWSYTDRSFTAIPPSHATFVYPQNGASNINTTKPFTWSAVPGAQGHYLYVGSSQGASDLVNSGGLSASTTSYTLPPLPVGTMLWARVWTEVNGAWAYYSDVSFQVTVSAARLTHPTAASTDFDTRGPFTWTAAPNGQSYYVWIGSTPGGKDLASSGGLPASAMSWTGPPLPVGQTLYARLFTELNGQWSTYTDTQFTVAYSSAKLTYPNPRFFDPNVDVTQPFTWTPVSGAQAYALWIGTSPGASDVLSSGQLPSPSYLTGALPVGGQLWARVWTLSKGAWTYLSDVPFTAAADITAPAQQALNVDPTQPITWAPGSTINGNAATYELMLGTKPGANDLYDSGSITSTSRSVPSSAMPAGQAIYARVLYNLGDGTQRVTDNVFAVNGGAVPPAQLNWGANGRGAVDTSLPFTWTASDLAQAYRVEILSGSSTVADSGPIHVPAYFDEALPTGTYTAQLGTELGGTWQWTTSTFSVASSGRSATNEITSAHWATDFVRHMADLQNHAYAWTELYQGVNTQARSMFTNCADYSDELLRIYKQMNIAGSLPANEQPFRFNIQFDDNTNDGHTLVHFYNTDDSDWILMDPTFDLAMKRASDGHWATVQDAQNATIAMNWSAIQYVALGDLGLAPAKRYYLDYPLLYLNALPPWHDPHPYLTALPALPTGTYGVYTVSADQNPVSILEDGVPQTVPLGSQSGLAVMFQASTIALPSGSTAHVTAYKPNFYVFTGGTFQLRAAAVRRERRLGDRIMMDPWGRAPVWRRHRRFETRSRATVAGARMTGRRSSPIRSGFPIVAPEHRRNGR